MNHQHWHQGSNVEGEACIDKREGDEEESAEVRRRREAGRSQWGSGGRREAGKTAAALRLKYIHKGCRKNGISIGEVSLFTPGL